MRDPLTGSLDQRLPTRIVCRRAFLLSVLASTILLAGSASAAPERPTVAATTSAGKALAALIAKRDAAAIFARFTPPMGRKLSQAQLQSILDTLMTEATPLGASLSESVRDEDDGSEAYVGEYRWRVDHSLMISVAFSPGGTETISALRFIPGPENPPAVQKLVRTLDALVLAKDVKALSARFTPALAAKLPPPELTRLLDVVTPPLGPRLEDSTTDAGQGYLHYVAKHAWKQATGQPMQVIFTLEAGGENRLAGILLQPGPAPKAAGKRKTAPAAPGASPVHR